MMTEAELNEGIATIIDSEKLAIKTKQGNLTLRDVLTAVYETQQTDARCWLFRLLSKWYVCPEAIILHLPQKVGQYINLSEGGKYLGFYNTIVDSLDVLTEIGLLDISPVWDYTDDSLEEYDLIPRYSVTQYGKAFVNHRENKKS